MRVGIGFDSHRLVTGRPFLLAGVSIPFGKGPQGHSDGDVLCHAIADALLGAAACGDIGQHFPDTDNRWCNAPGLTILAETVKIIASHNLKVSQIDTIVICETPALSPFHPQIQLQLSDSLGIPKERVGLKFKTAEGLGTIGASEAVASLAVAVVKKKQNEER